MTEIPPPPSMPPAMGVPAGSNPTAKNWMGIVALIAGIIGILGACCGLLNLLPPAAGIILGLLGKKADAAGEANNGKLANIGFILGVVGIALSVIFTIVAFALNGSVYYNPTS